MDPGDEFGPFVRNVYELLESSGLTIVISGHYEPKFMVDTLRDMVPYFRESRAMQNGFASMPGGGSLWVVLDSDQSSAVLLFIHPHDVSLMAEVISQLHVVSPQFTLTLVNSGEIEDPIVASRLEGTVPIPAREVIPSESA